MGSDQGLYERVRSLNGDYRTALLNRCYYGRRVVNIQRWQLALDLIAAVAASGAIGAWAIWRQDAGEVAWVSLTGVAAIVAAAKPVLQLPKQLTRLVKLFEDYSTLVHDLEQVVRRVRADQAFGQAAEIAHAEAGSRLRALAPVDDPKPNEGARRACFAKVNREVPYESLWWPPIGD